MDPTAGVQVLRGEILELAAGAIFLFVGLAACSIAAIRRRRGVRVFLWLGVWSAMYGAQRLIQAPPVVAASPAWLRTASPYASTTMTYLLVVAGSLAFFELSLGGLRLLMKAATALGASIAIAGVAVFAWTGSADRLITYNNVLATAILLVLIVVVAVPRLSARYLALPYRGVLLAGTLAFAVEALSVNVAHPFGHNPPRVLDHLGFAALLCSFGYAALQQALTNERRLFAVEDELAIAREIQRAILPESVPRIGRLRMSAAYRPMTAVAGDFYDFVPTGQKAIGVLVADVAGHGVPAALIASMIKVGVQSVTACAQDPGALLRGLNRILSNQLRSRLVSAAYLWLDPDSSTALYSAAGHPPLLRWRGGGLERIESNGMLFGMAEDGDYPVLNTTALAGDRFILYTDGVTDTEDARGCFFGDARLEEVIRANRSRTPSEFSDILLGELSRWRPASAAQQDDITLIVIDVA
jgi:sigma-B regulation protein RsbU (phosphoserine phosphatase)